MSDEQPPGAWRNRIVHTGDAPISEIVANPANWRTHPKHQADALAGVLDSVGFVSQVVINARSGRLVDGHLRVELAEAHGETSVPAVWVDLDDDEERLILATLDPLGALAGTDAAQLSALLTSVSTSDDALRSMLDGLAQRSGLIAPIDAMSEWQGMPAFEHEDMTAHQTVVVRFKDAASVELFARLLGRAMTASTKSLWFPDDGLETIASEYGDDASA